MARYRLLAWNPRALGFNSTLFSHAEPCQKKKENLLITWLDLSAEAKLVAGTKKLQVRLQYISIPNE